MRAKKHIFEIQNNSYSESTGSGRNFVFQLGGKAREGGESHQKKEGTPTGVDKLTS